MKYYYCPGHLEPVNMTKAIFDHSGKCPTCGNGLQEVTDPALKQMAANQELLDAAATAEALGGKGRGAQYLGTHKRRK